MNARTDRLQRIRLLPPHIEIMLTAHKGEEAREACREPEGTAAAVNATILNAMATCARGSVELAEGDPQAALLRLRSVFEDWQRTEVPYWAARARVLLGWDSALNVVKLDMAECVLAHLCIWSSHDDGNSCRDLALGITAANPAPWSPRQRGDLAAASGTCDLGCPGTGISIGNPNGSSY